MVEPDWRVNTTWTENVVTVQLEYSYTGPKIYNFIKKYSNAELFWKETHKEKEIILSSFWLIQY